jgi:methyl-accepting chemotaxis protein WspA
MAVATAGKYVSGGRTMILGTVRARLILGLSTIIALMIGLCFFSYLQLDRIEAQAIRLNVDSVPGLAIISRLDAASISAHSLLERHVLETDGARIQELAPVLQSETANSLALLKEYESTIVTPKDRELYDSIKAAHAPYTTLRGQVLRLGSDANTKNAAKSLLVEQVEPAYERVREAIQAEVDFNRANAEESGRQIRDAVTRAQTAILVGLAVALLLAFAAGFVLLQAISRPLSQLVGAAKSMSVGNFSQRLAMQRAGEFGVLADGFNLMADSLQEMIRRIQKSGLQINSSATEIAATAQEQLSTASEVAATTSEIGATSKEISATSRELAQTLKEIAEVAEKTAELAGSGQAGLARMKTTIQQVVEASAAIHARLGALSEKTSNIGTVVTTITKVADQTNLLSLNAAIEAEKAGDYGRGFAVVATEIRRLADQTAMATGDIEQMVKEMQSATAAGVMGMDKFSEEVRHGVEVVQQVSEELSQIIHHVQALTPNFETVSEGMQSQSLGAQQISDALSQLSEASKQTVESLRQSNVAIEQLNDASRGLQDGVARFTLQV